MKWKNVLIGLAVPVLFSLLFILTPLGEVGDQVYDLFLGFRAERDRNDDFVFLDVDDSAIAYNGIFPWPRSITAEALLRLKEYGARAAIFDIEYIDKSPPGVDAIYLENGLPADFGRAFSEITSATTDFISALTSGRMGRADIDEYSKALDELIRDEHDSLFSRAQRIARDNDHYLIQSSALYGNSWVSLNLRQDNLTDEEQSSRRSSIAEKYFSYPVKALDRAFKGKYVDIIPPLPGFSMVAAGAGFTNVEIDSDGTRRRIDLAQNIHDHWYLQLAFSPLINFLGEPEIELSNRRLLIKEAKLPGGEIKDISVPLDGNGRMLLDWPKTKYVQSYEHISFYLFSLLETDEAELERYARAIGGSSTIGFFAQFDSSLARIPIIIGNLEELYDAIHMYRDAALENCSDEYFDACIDFRDQSRELIRDLLEIDPGARVNAMVPDLVEIYPESAEFIYDEAAYLTNITEWLKFYIEEYDEVSGIIRNAVSDKFCILGRVDTGTTDIGANPFHAEYVNVGTHGVVIDMILSGIFINPIGVYWQILFTIIFVFGFFLFSAHFAPVPRAVSGLFITLFIAAAAAFLFRFTGIFFNPFLAVLAMITAVILREIISYAGSEREKQFIRKAFSTYVSNDVVQEIIADPSRLQLGGTKRHMTAIFTDVRGFSTISEQLDPEGLVTLLNRYLTHMSDVILEQKGTIDKYEGDAIIAFFGAPMPLPDHAVRACISAITMRKIEARLNKEVMEEKLSPSPLLTRFGINTGSMVAGNMGTGNKMNYTIMGNAVNLAARLEGVNKQYGTWILASDDTVKETEGRILTRKLDKVRVVGINEPVRLHNLIEIMDEATPEQKKLVEVFHEALDNFEQRKWKEALRGFKETLLMENGGPSAKYIERCEAFLKKPPAQIWDGVYNLTEK